MCSSSQHYSKKPKGGNNTNVIQYINVFKKMWYMHAMKSYLALKEMKF